MLSDKIKAILVKSTSGQPVVDFSNRDTLVISLVHSYQIIKETEPLLKFASMYAEGAYKDYLEEHLAEERGHDEMLREDLISVGIDPAYVAAPKAVDKLIYYQVESIPRTNGLSLMGYMAILECGEKPINLIENLEKIHGKKLLRTLRLHAVEDVKHAAELWAMIDTFGDGRVLRNAGVTARYCTQIANIIGGH